MLLTYEDGHVLPGKRWTAVQEETLPEKEKGKKKKQTNKQAKQKQIQNNTVWEWYSQMDFLRELVTFLYWIHK